ncbi:MAG: hypothetical protein K2K80_08465 [Clostridia bacterium]|nr:hypothetical protein [Clostridia bacterium]
MSDKISFKIIDGQIPDYVITNFIGVVGVFINDREILDIVADIENENLEGGAWEYIHQMAKDLYSNLLPDDEELKEWQDENGAEILCCTCGEIMCGSPTVFIEQDEKYVYWKALGHNQLDYYYPLNYVFDRKQYEQALEELKKFSEDKSIY